MYIKDIFKRLLDPVIALATLGNICIILMLFGVIGTEETNTITKVGTTVVAILIQLGIMKQPSNLK